MNNEGENLGSAVLSLMRSHRSRRAYVDEELPPGLLEDIVDAARFASTSSFVQAYSVIAVKDKERRKKLHELCGRQSMILEAPVFLAICADMKRLQLACEMAGSQAAPMDHELFITALIDASLVAQNLSVAVEAHGLGACMVGAARNHPVRIAELLALPKRVFVAFGMVIGKPSDDPLPRGRLPLAAVLHEERYSDDHMREHLMTMDEQFRTWARRCNAEGRLQANRPINEELGWTHRMLRRVGVDKPASSRDRMREALALLDML